MNRLKTIELHIYQKDNKCKINIIKREMHKTNEVNNIMEIVKIKVSDNFQYVKKKLHYIDNTIE